MIVDESGNGIHWANRQISELAGKLHGEYVYILDDDDFIICETFIHELKLGIKDPSYSYDPDVIIVKGWIHEKEYPRLWREAPARQKIAAPNFIVRRDIFDEYAHYWDVDRRGDFNFINAVWINGHQFKWWDRYIFYADPSSGKTEDQKNVIRERVYY